MSKEKRMIENDLEWQDIASETRRYWKMTNFDERRVKKKKSDF